MSTESDPPRLSRAGGALGSALGAARARVPGEAILRAVAAKLPRCAQELLGYAVHDSIPRGGGYLGMVRMQDPVELLTRGEL